MPVWIAAIVVLVSCLTFHPAPLLLLVKFQWHKGKFVYQKPKQKSFTCLVFLRGADIVGTEAPKGRHNSS